MQLSIVLSGVNRIPNCAIQILNLFNICLLHLLIVSIQPPTIDVAVEEKEGFFRFMAKIELEGAGDEQVRTLAVEIHLAGARKIVVRKGNAHGEDKHELNVDTYWRYRLTASTMPELAAVVFVDEELIVMVPKDDQGRGEYDNGSRGVWRDAELVLVQ
ncbi:hypothetical protein EJD97_008634 [Solanum chilense]|uniref:Uncharacterized protein n=1 Tax=Solanum chilense TaxID=4083 RepID=A0A6N2AKI9_SOLCI|nr:hypothetical protein EJD97_008634 [Solanum chilense]